MLNKPRYTLFKNTRYALNGLIEVTKNESSFRLQLLLLGVGTLLAWLLPVGMIAHLILSLSLFIPLMAEVTNSAIERVVDLVTSDHHELAKRAKDAGAALVFLSLFFLGAIWVSVLWYSWRA